MIRSGKSLFIFLLAILLVCTIFAVPVFAYTPSQLGNGFTPFPWVQSSSRPDGSLYVSDGLGPVNGHIYYLGYSSTLKNIYWCYVHYGNNWQLYAMSDAYFSGISSYNDQFQSFSNSSNSSQAYYENGSIATGVYSTMITNAQVVSVPLYFSSFDDALDAFIEFRDGGFSTDVTERFLYSMPSGYLLKLSSTASFSVDRRFYSVMNSTYNYLHLKNNSAGSDGVTDFRENGAFHGVVSSSSLVNGATLGSIFTGSGNEVPWQPTNANILGRATDYSYLGTQSWSVPVGSSFVIWYPYYYGLTDPDINEPDISLNLLISHSQPLSVEVIKIQADSTVYDNSVIVTSSLTGDSTTGSQAETGDDQITITTTNTPTGGGNAGDAPLSDNTSVLGVLSRLTNLITGLFHDAIDAIQSLVNTGSSFMQVVAGMFSWLPPELLGVLSSALIVIVVIGVVKLLL